MSISDICTNLRNNISRVIVGKNDIIDKVIICLLCDGHILLEDIPGTGKTTLAKTLSLSINSTFKRVQFTPDLLPSELTGLRYFDQKESDFVFKKGLIFTNILLADEINRATPRTQSSLLECMEERQVSDNGVTYRLDKPFIVIATQNPVEIQGTFPLPEAQLDRFFMRLAMGYPRHHDEINMLERFMSDNPGDKIISVISAEEIISAQEEVRKITVSYDIMEYIINIVTATREQKEIRLGVSPRGSLALLHASQGHAAINGRDYVIPDDVKAVAADVLAHRIILHGAITNNGHSNYETIEKIISKIPVPIE